jgi:three-Cys-motif partner protein
VARGAEGSQPAWRVSDELVALSNPEQLGPPPRDGLPTRPIKQHSKQKAYYWCRYAESAATKLKNVFRGGRMCVDLYAAAGICEDANGDLSWGSPLVALQVSNPYDIYFFNDLDPTAVSALTARVERFAPAGSSIHTLDLDDPGALARLREIAQLASPFGPKIIISRGDANAAPLYVRALRPPGRRYTLALIDPQSATFHWHGLEALAYGERSLDVLTLFPDASDLARGLAYYLNRPKSGEKLDAYFGTSEWREIARQNPRRAEHDLREFYEERMLTYLDLRAGKPKGIGFTSRPLYHLVFGSKNEKGIELWNDVNKRAPWTQDELFFGFDGDW